MSKSDYTPEESGHQRRESELSAPVSDYEYFQFSPTAARPPQTPVTPAAPPLYTGAAQTPVSPGFSSNTSQTGATLQGSDNQSTLPEVVPPGHQITPKIPEYQLTPDHGEKEAYAPPKTYHNAAMAVTPTGGRFSETQEDPSPAREERKRYIFGLSKKGFIIVLVVLIVLIIAIAVGVGVGVGVGTHKKTSPSSNSSTGQPANITIGGALNPQYYSTQGAFNGSGVALADVNFGADNSLYVFYQKYTGEIEQLIYEADGTWNFVTQVATNAKNSTPLSTVAYIQNSVATWHLFYVSEDNYLKQRVQTNASQYQTNIWEDGPINDLNLRVNDADTVGMQACYWGNYYGSLSNYHGGNFSASNSTPTTGMNIWYADTDTTFQQYDWTNGQGQWNFTRSWNNMNTHAGIGCQSWLTNTTSYVFMVDNTNTLKIWWRDIDTNKTSTATHPIDAYTLAEGVSFPNVHPSSSLGYTDFMIYQTSDYVVHGVNLTWAAENTSIAPAQGGTSSSVESNSHQYDEWALQPQDAAIGGTHMAITGSILASGGRQERLFYQQVGNDLRLGKRDAVGGDFSFVEVPLNTLKTTK